MCIWSTFLGIAHDEVIPFSIRGGKLRIHDEAVDFDGKLNVQFMKVSCAFAWVVLRHGHLTQVVKSGIMESLSRGLPF